jgi:hypothetical protein
MRIQSIYDSSFHSRISFDPEPKTIGAGGEGKTKAYKTVE